MIPLAKPDLTGNEGKYLSECIETGYVTHTGRFVKDFESAFAKRFGAPALATSSGTGALHLALLALGVVPGDEIIVPDLAFGTAASAVLAVGARPVLVDIDPGTMGLDQRRVVGLLCKRTRAIISVNLYGEDAGDFRHLGIPVIEDSCEALGMVPMRGKMTCYSFYGNKTITTGEGGMLCGDFGDARKWRDGGFDETYRHHVAGLNYRMSNLHAAVGLAQLERFDELLGRRLANVARYGAALKGRGKWMFAAQVLNPVDMAKHLAANGVETRPIFMPLHMSPAFRVFARGKYKNAEEVWLRHLLLPTGPHVSENDIDKICELIHGAR